MNSLSFLSTGRSWSFRQGLLVLLAAVFCTLGVAEHAQAQISTSAVPFLRIEPDSRSAAMGNTGVALSDNANAIFWNPAGLGFQQGAEVALTHSTWLPEFNADLFYEYLVGKYHFPGVGTFGAHVTFLNLGEHERRDESNQPLGEFRSYELAVGTSYGRQLTENLSVGVGGRFIYSYLTDATADGQSVDPGTSFGLDLAALYRTQPFDLMGTPTQFAAGVNLANMGPAISYIQREDEEEQHRDPIPTNLRLGYALTFEFDEYNTLTFTNDFNKLLTRIELEQVVRDGDTLSVQRPDPFYQAIFTSWQPVEVATGTDPDDTRSLGALEQMTVGMGLEYWYDQLFALRSGFFFEHPDNGGRQFLNFGAGLRYNIVGIDFSYVYALQEQSPLSGTMRFSVLVDIPR